MTHLHTKLIIIAPSEERASAMLPLLVACVDNWMYAGSTEDDNGEFTIHEFYYVD
jgi:hypothetical protein